MKFLGAVSSILGKAAAIGKAIENGVVKAVQEVDTTIEPALELLKPIAEQVANAAAPGSAGLVDVAYAWLEESVAAIDAGGAAAEQHLMNAGLDAAAVAKIKSLAPAFKAAMQTPAGNTAKA